MKLAEPREIQILASERIAASYEAIDKFCSKIKAEMADKGLSKFIFTVEILLREALNNAVLHGSKEDLSKEILSRVTLATNTICLIIEDVGDGFDWKQDRAKEIDEEKTTGRGLSIYSLYADRVNFNEKGNRVELIINTDT